MGRKLISGSFPCGGRIDATLRVHQKLMGFADTYREEVIDTRRARGRTARFIGRLIGIVLTLGFMATLQSQPALRQAMAEAGMRGISAVMGAETTADAGSGPTLNSGSTLPRSRVPVTRAGERAPLVTPTDG